jgi:hypothetical protein
MHYVFVFYVIPLNSLILQNVGVRDTAVGTIRLYGDMNTSTSNKERKKDEIVKNLFY